METMEKRGAIKLEKHGVDHQMSDGSQVIKVSFTPIADEIRYALDKTKSKLDSKTPDIRAKEISQDQRNISNNGNILREREWFIEKFCSKFSFAFLIFSIYIAFGI